MEKWLGFILDSHVTKSQTTSTSIDSQVVKSQVYCTVAPKDKTHQHYINTTASHKTQLHIKRIFQKTQHDRKKITAFYKTLHYRKHNIAQNTMKCRLLGLDRIQFPGHITVMSCLHCAPYGHQHQLFCFLFSLFSSSVILLYVSSK